MESAAYARLYPREAYEKTLASGARGDGRPLGRARERTCATGVASGALGSALARHGATTACAGVTATIATPDATRPEEGFLEIAVDYAPQASEDARGRTDAGAKGGGRRRAGARARWRTRRCWGRI